MLAPKHGIRSIAFPAISTGAYSYPLKEVTEIAVGTVREALSQSPAFDDIVFCCYSGEDFATYKKVLGRVGV